MIIGVPSLHDYKETYQKAFAKLGHSFSILNPDKVALIPEQIPAIKFIICHSTNVDQLAGMGGLKKTPILLIADTISFGNLARKYKGKLAIAHRIDESDELDTEKLHQAVAAYMASHVRPNPRRIPPAATPAQP